MRKKLLLQTLLAFSVSLPLTASSLGTENEDKDNIMRLPTEVICEILDYLPTENLLTCRLVSEEMNRISSDSILWEDRPVDVLFSCVKTTPPPFIVTINELYPLPQKRIIILTQNPELQKGLEVIRKEFNTGLINLSSVKEYLGGCDNRFRNTLKLKTKELTNDDDREETINQYYEELNIFLFSDENGSFELINSQILKDEDLKKRVTKTLHFLSTERFYGKTQKYTKDTLNYLFSDESVEDIEEINENLDLFESAMASSSQ
jgi:hypothetical protein